MKSKRLWKFIPKPLKQRFLVRINYKSGIQEEFWTYYLWRHFENGVFKELKWEYCGNPHPDILNIDAMESMWIIEVRGIVKSPKMDK